MSDVKEYLRRNILHAQSVGVVHGVESILAQVEGWDHPPKWLVRKLRETLARAEPLRREMAKHRDEVKP